MHQKSVNSWTIWDVVLLLLFGFLFRHLGYIPSVCCHFASHFKILLVLPCQLGPSNNPHLYCL